MFIDLSLALLACPSAVGSIRRLEMFLETSRPLMVIPQEGDTVFDPFEATSKYGESEMALAESGR